MAYTIMIVDDSAITRAVLKKTVHMTGYDIEEIHECANGREALEKLECRKPDLIFADLNMPEMNGMEMMREILNREETQDIPVVVISTEASTTRIAGLRDQGVQGYIHKPFTPEMIKDVLHEVLEPCST